MAAEKAQVVYNGACNLVGVAPASIAVSGVAAGVATDVVVKAGIGLGTKLMIGVATVLTTGAIVVGGMAATGNLPFGEVADSSEDSQSENNSQNDSGKEDVKVEKYIVSQITNAVSSGQYIVSSVRYEFDEDGVLTSVEFYDENGKPYKQETYYASGKMRAEVNVRSDGKIIRSVQYNPEGNVQQIEEKKYDEHGMPIWQLQEMGAKHMLLRWSTNMMCREEL